MPEFPLQTGTAAAGETWFYVGMVYEIIKIYSEKFITNNSENKKKLSYTILF